MVTKTTLPQVRTAQLATTSIDPKSVELTADVVKTT